MRAAASVLDFDANGSSADEIGGLLTRSERLTPSRRVEMHGFAKQFAGVRDCFSIRIGCLRTRDVCKKFSIVMYVAG